MFMRGPDRLGVLQKKKKTGWVDSRAIKGSHIQLFDDYYAGALITSIPLSFNSSITLLGRLVSVMTPSSDSISSA